MTVAHANQTVTQPQPSSLAPIAPKVQNPLETLAELVAQHGTEFAGAMRLEIELPTKTTLGTIIPGAFDRFVFDTDGWITWVHSKNSGVTYAAQMMDAIRWLRVLEEVLK
jgi:hypothetical protein